MCTKCLLQPSVKAQFPGIMDFFFLLILKSQRLKVSFNCFFKWHLGLEDWKLAKDRRRKRLERYANTATGQADRPKELMRRVWKTSEKMEHTAALCLQG